GLTKIPLLIDISGAICNFVGKVINGVLRCTLIPPSLANTRPDGIFLFDESTPFTEFICNVFEYLVYYVGRFTTGFLTFLDSSLVRVLTKWHGHLRIGRRTVIDRALCTQVRLTSRSGLDIPRTIQNAIGH